MDRQRRRPRPGNAWKLLQCIGKDGIAGRVATVLMELDAQRNEYCFRERNNCFAAGFEGPLSPAGRFQVAADVPPVCLFALSAIMTAQGWEMYLIGGTGRRC